MDFQSYFLARTSNLPRFKPQLSSLKKKEIKLFDEKKPSIAVYFDITVKN
jgi:hypothetical protein